MVFCIGIKHEDDGAEEPKRKFSQSEMISKFIIFAIYRFVSYFHVCVCVKYTIPPHGEWKLLRFTAPITASDQISAYCNT